MSLDIEELAKPFWLKEISQDNIYICYEFLDLYYQSDLNKENIKNHWVDFQRKRVKGNLLKFGTLIYYYKLGRENRKYPNPDYELEECLKVMNVRENSGVMVFSIFTSGYPSYTKINEDGTTEKVFEFGTEENSTGEFGCKYDCHYCPKFPNMPRSYISTEPGVARAVQCNFDPIKQIFYRATEYIRQGHPIDKAEVIIQGGTWDSYSKEYRTEFIRDTYYAFNVIMDYFFNINDNNDYFEYEGHKLRAKKTLKEEIKLNENGQCRVIGLTPETRPDQINLETIKFLREIGATRVQLGIQHTDDKLLKHINRACYHKHSVKAIKMLKDNGFKCDLHLLLDLPCPEDYVGKMHIIDRAMLEQVNTDPDLKVDQIKIYPCVVTPWTKIKEWFDAGIYKPYGTNIPIDKEVYRRMDKDEKFQWRMSNPLYKNIFYFYTQIHPSIRVNRIFRDIPTNIICGGTTNSGIRSEIDRDMELMDLTNGCIRFREAGNYQNISRASKSIPVLKELEFESSGGTEYFLSWESEEQKPILYSFLRLRLSPNAGKTNTGKVIFPELVDCALVRELHTYGKIKPCKENLKYYQDKGLLFGKAEIVQHRGFGKKLLERAEQIAITQGYTKIAVIAGVGVREYYRTMGFTLDSEEGCYQIKILNNKDNQDNENNENNENNKNKINYEENYYINPYLMLLILFSLFICNMLLTKIIIQWIYNGIIYFTEYY
jgi:ELP3 family radical SAM enzyme/protein acetyltransferase